MIDAEIVVEILQMYSDILVCACPCRPRHFAIVSCLWYFEVRTRVSRAIRGGHTKFFILCICFDKIRAFQSLMANGFDEGLHRLELIEPFTVEQCVDLRHLIEQIFDRLVPICLFCYGLNEKVIASTASPRICMSLTLNIPVRTVHAAWT